MFLIENASILFDANCQTRKFIWIIITPVQGKRSQVISESSSLGKSCVLVSARISLFERFASCQMSQLYFLRDPMFRRHNYTIELVSTFSFTDISFSWLTHALLNLSYSWCTQGSALTWVLLISPKMWSPWSEVDQLSETCTCFFKLKLIKIFWRVKPRALWTVYAKPKC